MIDTKQIYWLAGLLEGEGCFVSRKENGTPRIFLHSTDLDVVSRAAAMFGVEHIGSRKRASNKKRIYSISVGGSRAASWMMTLYKLLGIRRQAKIRAVLIEWQCGRMVNGLPAACEAARSSSILHAHPVL